MPMAILFFIAKTCNYLNRKADSKQIHIADSRPKSKVCVLKKIKKK
jgi:hypothetical protein